MDLKNKMSWNNEINRLVVKTERISIEKFQREHEYERKGWCVENAMTAMIDTRMNVSVHVCERVQYKQFSFFY